MKRPIDWIVLIIFLVGLITIFYIIFKFAGWVGIVVSALLVLFGIPKSSPQNSVEVPKDRINKIKQYEDDLKGIQEQQKSVREEAERLQKEMENFLEELKGGNK